MFVPLSKEGELSFKDNILVLPSVSVGNVGQLACDLLIFNAGDKVEKVGFLKSRNILPLVGNDAFNESGSGDIVTSTEVFQLSEHKVTIIQQRAPFVLGRSRNHAKEISDWALAEGFSKIILLGAADSGFWGGDDIVYRKFFYASLTPNQEHEDFFSARGIRPLQQVEASSIEMFKQETNSPEKLCFPAARAGILNPLFDECNDKLTLLGILLFCKEGHNVEEAISMASLANELLGMIPAKDNSPNISWKAPHSWKNILDGRT